MARRVGSDVQPIGCQSVRPLAGFRKPLIWLPLARFYDDLIEI
jgi:hypothetical protein